MAPPLKGLIILEALDLLTFCCSKTWEVDRSAERPYGAGTEVDQGGPHQKPGFSELSGGRCVDTAGAPGQTCPASEKAVPVGEEGASWGKCEGAKAWGPWRCGRVGDGRWTSTLAGRPRKKPRRATDVWPGL